MGSGVGGMFFSLIWVLVTQCVHFIKIPELYVYDLCTFQYVYLFLHDKVFKSPLNMRI